VISGEARRLGLRDTEPTGSIAVRGTSPRRL
jgi:hypothetical protein